MRVTAHSNPPAKTAPGASASAEPRPPIALPELIDMLVRGKLISAQQGKDLEARATTLRSRVLKDRVGSVRSQAAARYDVSAAEIVAAAALPHAQKEHRKVDEDAIAQAIASEAGLRYLKIDPLRLDNALISKTFSRPFVRHHVVIPIAQETEGLVVAVADPFDTTLRETLQDVLRRPFVYAVTTKRDILAVADRVFGLRSSIKQASSELGAQSPTQALVQIVQLRSNEELAELERRARGRRGRLPDELRVRAARVGHPPRAARRTTPWCASASTASCTTSSRIRRRCTPRSSRA